MTLSECERIITKAIQAKLVVEVDYIHKDGTRTLRLVEPFDIAPWRRSKSGEYMFWGWCLFHNKMEQRSIPGIVDIKITDQPFDPSIREATFTSPPNYRISRNW